MTTAKAVSELRESMGVTQRDFAEKLGTTIETVSRWENGRREPTREAIEKLATLAHSAGIRHLRNFFLSQEVAGIVSRVKGLKTPGSERHIALKELKYWSAYLHETHAPILKILALDATIADRRSAHKLALDYLRAAAHVMEYVRDRIELYVDEDYSSGRMQEDQEILRWGHQHDSFTKGELDAE